MNLKIALPVIAGLGLTLFSFKPVTTAKITRLTNGNFELKGVNISDKDIKELNQLSTSGFIFRKTVTKDKDASKVTESLATTGPIVNENMEMVNDIMSRYE
jgi:hypothetical protein